MRRMANSSPPTTMRAWQYSSTAGGITANLKLNPSAAVPKPGPDQSLVQIIAAALNPVDYKPAEMPVLGRLLVPKLATPGNDFCGRIITTSPSANFQPGDLVFGVIGSNPFAGGALAEFGIMKNDSAIRLPEGIAPLDAAAVTVAGLTAYQTIVPQVKKGDRIFINGGSGGTGVFGIQVAKAVGCHVTTSCGTGNVELCKSLGADVVIDYRKESVVDTLVKLAKESGAFDHLVDNVGLDPTLFWRAHEYMKPAAVFQAVAGHPSLPGILDAVKRMVWPGFLGGAKRTRKGYFVKAGEQSSKDLVQMVTWMKEGKVKVVVDEIFAFEQAPQAIEKLKTGRAKGKIVIRVASEK